MTLFKSIIRKSYISIVYIESRLTIDINLPSDSTSYQTSIEISIFSPAFRGAVR